MQWISSPSCSILPGNSVWFSAQRTLELMCQDRGRLGSSRFSFFWFHGNSKSEHSAVSSAGEEIPAAHSQECLESCEYEQSLLPLSSGSLDWQRVGLMLVGKAVREVHLLHLSEKGPEGKQRHWNHPSCHRQWHFRNDFICQPDSSFPDSSESCHGLHTPCGTKPAQDSRFKALHINLFLLW